MDLKDKNIFNIIDSLNVSNGWKKIFKKIQISYYPNFYQGKANNMHFWRYSQPVSNLSKEERFIYFTRFNFLALIFGPLYYLAKFILIKGFILLAIEIALIYHFGFPIGYLSCFVHIYAAIFANSDYFSKMVLNSKEVKNNPGLLSDCIDDNFIKTINRDKNFYTQFCTFCIISSIILVTFLYFQFANDAKYQRIIEHKQRVCTSKQECTELIKTSLINIRAKKEPLYKEYFKLGAAYYELGNKRDALLALNHSTVLKSNYLFSYLLKGIIYTETAQYQLARKNYETALKIYPNGKFLYYLIGSSYYKEGQYLNAEKNFLKAVKAYPDKASYREALAYARIYLKDKVNAKIDLEKTIRLLKKEKGGESKNGAKIEALEAYIKRLR